MPRPFAIPRPLMLMLAWLSTGALINIAIAWTAMCLPTRMQRPSHRVYEIRRSWPVSVPDTWPTDCEGHIDYRTGSDDAVYQSSERGGSTRDGDYLAFVLHAGVPFRSLSCWSRWRTDQPEFVDRGEWTINIPGLGLKGLPLLPMWTGFVGNSVVYAAAGFTGLWMVRRLRRQERLAQNQCTGCGYSLAGPAAAGLCPECGTPVQSSSNSPHSRQSPQDACGS